MLTKKDLEIINAALAQYEAMMDEGYDDELGHGTSEAYEFHKEDFGNPEKTINATRARVLAELHKRKVGALC
jgi:hypothetical protein